MCGALFQFVPVLVARPLFSESLALPALALLTLGLAALLAGFLASWGQAPALALAASRWRRAIDHRLLPDCHQSRSDAAARTTAAGRRAVRCRGACLLMCHRRIWRNLCVRTLRGRHVAVSVRRAAACHRGAGRLAHIDRHGRELPAAFDVHAVAGCRRTQEPCDAACRRVDDCDHGRRWAGGGCGASGWNVVFSLVAASAILTLAFYGRDVVTLYRSRKRRALELNTRMAVWSFASLAAAAVLGAILAATQSFASNVGAFAFRLHSAGCRD
jgi:hypothetical protein